jgi:RecJ-like exonuclease
MKTSRINIALSTIVILGGMSSAQNKFVGAKTCAMCHKSGKGGTSYTVWEKSKHAGAYKTLLGEDAKKIAVKRGLKVAPSKAPECLKCHVTGGGVAKNSAASAFKMVHSKGDTAKSRQAGLNPGEKTEKFCTTCHNSQSPTFKGFKLDEMWKKIAHGLPAKK